MPYIRIKAYPKDQTTKEKVVEAITIMKKMINPLAQPS